MELQPTGLQLGEPLNFTYNHQALISDGRLFSVYKLDDRFTPLADALWIITESDRSHTTILFPSEY